MTTEGVDGQTCSTIRWLGLRVGSCLEQFCIQPKQTKSC